MREVPAITQFEYRQEVKTSRSQTVNWSLVWYPKAKDPGYEGPMTDDH